MPEPEQQTVIASAAVQVRVPAGTAPADLTALMHAVYTLIQQANLPIIVGRLAVQGQPSIVVPVPPQ